MKITLLTHQRELDRKTNTGVLALDNCGELVERVVWERRNPDPQLVTAIECGDAVLVYPTDNESEARLQDFSQVILIDATWQEARKIYNHSPYLKAAPKLAISKQAVSNYRLRRNQPEGGLCTAECVIEILRRFHKNDHAKRLEYNFAAFNRPPGTVAR